jgi:glycosyltransferase involved in cell wall biosynthesis
MTRVAIVVQRFGTSIVGGAESHAFLLVERLHRELNWSIDVYSSTASDYRTWASDLPTQETIQGMRVFRFAPKFGRLPAVMAVFGFVLRCYRKVMGRLFRGSSVQKWLETGWLIAQGPYVPDLVRTLVKRQHEYQLVIFFTYLYYPTILGLPRITIPKILVPTAHDEFPFYFESVRQILLAANVIAANTTPEIELIRRVHQIAEDKLRVVGIGFEPQTAGVRPENSPYAFYLGRICRGKGVDQLIEFFVKFKEQNPTDQTHLLLAGKVENDVVVPERPDIRCVGFLNESEKWRYIHHANVLINPSPYESLSMVAIEAMAAGVPLLLYSGCEVFRHYGRVCPSVGTFENAEDFCSKLKQINDTDWRCSEAARRLEKTKQWALDHYSWQQVLTKYAVMATAEDSGKKIAGYRSI